MVINHSIFKKYFLTTYFVPDPAQELNRAVSAVEIAPASWSLESNKKKIAE